MNPKQHITSIITILSLIITMNAKSNTPEEQPLDARQKSMIRISAFTARGEIEELNKALNEGLDAGLTVSEIKETLVQLYAYCGFPRSLNGINTFMNVLNQRKDKGITDKQGKENTVNNTTADKYEQGRKVLETLTQTPQARPAPGFGEFAPRIDAFLKEHLFADIFESEVLTYQQRELVTIAALASMPGVEPQLFAHINMGINVGVTRAQLEELFTVIETTVGKSEAENGRKILENILNTLNNK